MPMPTYSFSEFIDRLMVRLHDRTQEKGDPIQFFDLLELAKEFNEPAPEKWVLDAANELRAMGLATILINSAGVYGQITGRGRLYVERGQGKTTDIASRRDQLFHNVQITVNGNDNQVAIGRATQTATVQRESGPAAKLVEEMRNLIRSDQSLNEATKQESEDYLELVSKEIKKPEPNQNILSAVLEPLSQIASIAGKIAMLIQYLNG
jgi:hypothetical protein